MTVDHKSGFVADGGGQVTNGYGTHSTTLVTGVNVTGSQTGVVGHGPTGVQGQGTGASGIGVQGQAAGAHGCGVKGQAADPMATGVMGTGTGIPGIGVQGVSGPDAGSASGTGVFGQSLAGGVGMMGASSGDDTTAYIGVFGQAQADGSSLDPYNPANPGFGNDYLSTGVFGIGDRYGGVFQATPAAPGPGGSKPYANIQLSPMQLGTIPVEGVGEYAPASYEPGSQLQQLSSQGQPGDIIAIPAKDDENRPSVEVWVCIRPAAAINPRLQVGATWARINFDTVATMPAG
jgi:hypothetical protein